MRLLLDTRLAIWWQISAKSLSAETVALVQDAEKVFVSRASLWEMAIKSCLGKLHIDLKAFASHTEAAGFEWLDIKNEHILRIATLPLFDNHKDPFDHLLIAQSLIEPMILLTADKTLAHYGQTIRIV